MAAITKAKTLVYKQVKFVGGDADFQDLLLKAMARRKRATQREMEYHDDSSLLLNTFRKAINSTSCGVIMRFTRGNNQPFVSIDPEAAELTMAQVAPPPTAEEKTKNEFVENFGFFCAYKSHLIIAQSASIRQSSFVDYFNWLLRDEAQVLSEGDGLVLLNPPPPTMKKGIKGVKTLRFYTPLAEKRDLKPSVVNEEARVSMKSHQWAGLREILSGLGIHFHDVPIPANEAPALKMELTVSLDRRHFADESELLNVLGTVTHEQAGEHYELELMDGTKISGTELVISNSVRVDAPGGVPSPSGMFKEMSNYLGDLYQNDRI